MANVGRPSSYEPKYCAMLEDHMGSGMSFESFSAKIGVHRDTLYEWVKVHPEFSDAKKKAHEKCLYFYEAAGVAGMMGKIKNFNTAAWCFNMKNRFKWKDKHELMVEEVKPTMIKRLSGEVIELGVEQVGSNDDERDL